MQDHSSAAPDIIAPAGLGLSRLRILATSDLHAHIMPWDYHADRASSAIGLARTASLIAAARAEVACCLLVDNGDFLQGSPLGDVEALRAQGDGARLHPMIAAMNALGYDVAALGNHEFSHGLPFLLQSLAGARFPVVSANIVRRLGASPLEDEALVPPTLVLHRMLRGPDGVDHPLRIGIVGLTPPQTTQWDRAKLGDALSARDIVEAAAAHVPALRAKGTDLVLALSHSGIGSCVAQAWMEDASTAVAALPGIDAVVTGHTHLTFPSTDHPQAPGIEPVAGLLSGKPAVMPGMFGSHLGVIDLDLRWDGARWQVQGGQSALRPIARRGPSGRLRTQTRSAPEIVALAEPAHRATRLWARRPVGVTRIPLHSYFAMIAPSPTVRLIARAQAVHVCRALQGGPHGDLPVLSAAAPFHAGGRGGPENYTHIAAGRVTLRNVFDIYPYPNTIAALLVTGADLHDWLERSFSQFFQIAPGAQEADLLDPDFPSFNFDMIEGLTWTVDLSSPARCDARGEVIRPQANRILGLAFEGRPLTPDQRFVLATNSYRAHGSGGYGSATIRHLVLDRLKASRDVLRHHIAETGEIDADGPPNWHFRPMPGTTVLFDSAPAASDHLADLAPLAAEALGMTATGFRRFRLHL
jgi:2',3'-cyclic-nucleotide 2'-phosphodiesterase/3'-nucleotidase